MFKVQINYAFSLYIIVDSHYFCLVVIRGRSKTSSVLGKVYAHN